LLKLNGVKFTKHPDSYFDHLQLKHPHLDFQSLRKHGGLCDVVGGAYLFQVFTAPIGGRSTFFYEIVQRVNNYDGFGLDNIETLFNAMDLELNIRSNISLAN
jgi:4-hydroxyphenylpyruvate dioxygenase